MAIIKKKLENLKPGKDYLLTVRAKNSDLNIVSDYTDSIVFTVPQDQTVPTGINNLQLFSGIQSVMFVFDYSSDKDIDKYEYELYAYSDILNTHGIYSIRDEASYLIQGFSSANVFTVTIDNLQVATPFYSETEGLSQFFGRVRPMDTSGNLGEWTAFVQTDEQTPLIDNQYIGSLTASKITAGTIGAHTIQLDGNNSILKSSNFDGTESEIKGEYNNVTEGWLIAGDGNAYLANASIRGEVNATDFNLLDNTGRIVASLGPISYSGSPLSGSEIDVTPTAIDNGLIFSHFDYIGSAATPNFTDSGIVWSQGDDTNQYLAMLGPRTTTNLFPNSFSITEPVIELSNSNTINIGGVTPQTINSYAILSPGRTGSSRSSGSDTIKTRGTAELLVNAYGILSNDNTYFENNVVNLTTSNFTGVYNDLGDLASTTYSTSASLNINSFEDYSSIVFSNINLTQTTFFNIDNFSISAQLQDNSGSKTPFKIWSSGQISLGPSGSYAPWTSGTLGVAGFQRTALQIVENDSYSNAHLSLRHSNRGSSNLDKLGLDLAISRSTGNAFIIQRENANLTLRTTGPSPTYTSYDGLIINSLGATFAPIRLLVGTVTDDVTQSLTVEGKVSISIGGVKVLYAGADTSKSDTTNFLYSDAVYNHTSASGTSVVVDSNGRLRRFSSSSRYKENIESWNTSLQDILQLRPVSFTGKNDDPNTRIIGLIAEEVELVNPQVVQYSPHGEVEGVNYNGIIDMLINAIKELSIEINEIKSKID